METFTSEQLETLGKLELADRGKNLLDNAAVLRDSRRVVEAHNRRHLGDDYRTDGGDDMQLILGDVTNYAPPPTPPERPTPNETPMVAPASAAASRIPSALKTAALIAASVATGSALPLLLSRPPAPTPPIVIPAQPQTPATDHDTIFGLELGDPPGANNER